MLSEKITVAVSPFYSGLGWTDKYTSIEFKPSANYYPITISTNRDLTGIRRSLRLNTLVLLNGELPQPGEVLIEKELENLDPAELSNEQLKELVGDLKAGNEQLKNSPELKAIEEEKLALEKELESIKKELEATVEVQAKADEVLKLEKQKLVESKKEAKALTKQVKSAESYIKELEELLTVNSIEFKK